MKKLAYLALLSALFVSPAAAHAAALQGDGKPTGHFEYHWVRHYPRAPFLGAKRTWVPDKKASVSADCDMPMMKDAPSAVSCRREMQRAGPISRNPAS